MRRVVWGLIAALLVFAWAVPAQAAKTYDDPWLQGDLQQLRVPDALDILARTPQPVIVGDVDSGARLSDPDLAPHLLQMQSPYDCVDVYGGADHFADPANGEFGCDFVGDGDNKVPSTNPDGDPSDPFGHGTGTAAIIAAVPDNGIEGAGVAPNARVLPVRACYGGEPECYGEPAVAGFEYAVAMGATVINASWPPGNDYIPAFFSFVHDHPNVLFDFAIGGSDQNEDQYDLCTKKLQFPNVLCVGLVEPDDSAGTVNAEKSTDVSAPGYAGVPAADGSQTTFGYTSGATAHVTGAAAILRGLAPALTAPEIAEVLVSTSREAPGYETANRAEGIVDVEAAVRAVQELEGLATPAPGQGAPADTPDPFVAGPGGGGETNPPSPPGGSTPGTGSSGSSSTPAPTPAPPPTPPPAASPTLKLAGKLPTSVAAGAALKVQLQTSGPAANVIAALTHGKKTLAKTKRKSVTGPVTLTLHIPRGAKRGPAKLHLQFGGAAPLTKPITVTKPL